MMGALGDAAAFLAPTWPCFPCGSDKRPVTEHGFKDASRDPLIVRVMFDRPGAALIGVPTGEASDLVAVDLDVKNGASGLEWLAANAHRLPRTRQHATRSGGRHLLFRYPAGRSIRNSASKIAPGVDVRGNGGFIIVPPSPGYSIADDAMPAVMPAWLVELLDPPVAERPAPQPYTGPAITGDGTPYGLRALSLECDAIRSAPEGMKHHTLNKAAYSIGGLVSAGAISESTARAELAGALNSIRDRCADWHHAEKTLRQAFEQGKNKPRAVPEAPAAPPPRDYFGIGRQAVRHDPETGELLDPEPEPAKADGSLLPLVYYDDVKANLDVNDFVEGLLTTTAMSVVYGPSNCGKTFFMTDLALHVAAGWAWRGREIDAGGVIYCALEGGHGILNRVAAFKAHYKVEHGLPFAIVPVSVNLLDPNADRARLVETIKVAASRMGKRVTLVVIDTLSRALAGGNENAPDDMGALVSSADYIRQEVQAHICFIHHSGKDQAQGARGHSLLRAATDTEIEISRADKDSPSIVTVTKQRDLEIDGKFVFTLKKVDLGENRRRKPVTSCIVEAVDASAIPEPIARLSGGAKAAMSALHQAIIGTGQPSNSPDIPAGVRVVRLSDWRREFYARSHLDSQEAKQKAFVRAVATLRDAGAVGIINDVAWDANGSREPGQGTRT